MNEVEERVAELLQLFGICATLEPTFKTRQPLALTKELFGKVRHSIEGLWKWLAENAATRFKGAQIDNENPGYLIYNDVRVPFYLFQDLPGPKELDELVRLGRSLRVTTSGMVCLSGSAALLGL